MVKTTKEIGGWRVGDAVRCFDGAFGTGVILGFEAEEKGQDWYARIARPQVSAHDIGTPCAYPLIGIETFVAPVKRLRWAEESDSKRKYDGEGGARFLIASPEVIKTR